MAEIEEEKRRITIKIVYYGPALSGKTTNLICLHQLLNPSSCGDLMSLETRGDRTLFFDLLPVMIRSDSGYNIKIRLFTVPGQVAHDATRKAVLSRADGVVFVADSCRDQMMNNSVAFENLEKNAGRVGLDMEALPLVIQFNKRDLPDILSESEIQERWGISGIPFYFASALKGIGVAETYSAVLKQVYGIIDASCGLKANFAITEETFLSGALPEPY